MCNCDNDTIPQATGVYNGNRVYNHADCEGVSVELLRNFYRIISCTKSSNMLNKAGVSLEEANSAISVLTSWITAKEADPATCEYREVLPVIQQIVTKSVAYGQC